MFPTVFAIYFIGYLSGYIRMRKENFGSDDAILVAADFIRFTCRYNIQTV